MELKMSYKELILNKLLDKYEKSKSYLEDVNRKIILKLSELKQYNIENYDEKMLLHEVVKELKSKDLIDFNWIKFEEENILDKVWLIKEKIDLAYEEVKRDNPKHIYLEILREFENVKFQSAWLQEFQKDIIGYMNKNKKENSLLPNEKMKDIISALKAIDDMICSNNSEPILKRVFSIKCYNNSKYFEKEIESYIIRILKKYYTCDNLVMSELNNDEILAVVKITKYPEVIEFSGNIKCILENGEIVFSDIAIGNYINSQTIANVKNIELINVNKIIFIENKTNYINYIQTKKVAELVIYHGGVYSPIRGEFFKKIYKACNPNIQIYHWSDIDIGGFSIFTRLRDSIIKNLIPYKMDKRTLIENKEGWQSFSEDYRKRLEKLKGNEKYSCFFETIDFMLENNVRLEQEILIEVD